jgi:hypothetical protein
MHQPGLDSQHNWAAMTPSNFRRRLNVRRQMNMMTPAFDQPLLFDRSQKSFSRSVVKNFRRDGRGVSQLDLDRMPLIGPDPKAVITERKSLLVVTDDDILKFFKREFNPMCARRFDQSLYGHPAGFVGFETDLFGLMPQHKAEKFADPDCSFAHRNIRRFPALSSTPDTLSFPASPWRVIRSQPKAQCIFCKRRHVRPLPFDKRMCRWLSVASARS